MIIKHYKTVVYGFYYSFIWILWVVLVRYYQVLTYKGAVRFKAFWSGEI
jgi:hypothetical protein